ncbi:MAG: M48 family metalloprotease [Candidatus Omnitrophota bacterium]
MRFGRLGIPPREPRALARVGSIAISSAEEVQIGRSMSDVVIKEEEKPLADPAKQRALNSIGNKIVGVSDRRDIVYHFMVLDNKDLNAFALPGGYIFVYRGLFDRLKESELAAVVAHEIAHAAAKHAVKRMQSALGYDVLLLLVSVGLGNKNPTLLSQISGVSNTVFGLLSRGYSREDELEADRLAVKYLMLAGVDPQGMVRALEFLLREKGPSGRVFEVLSTHPRMEERIKKVKEQIEKYKVNPPTVSPSMAKGTK